MEIKSSLWQRSDTKRWVLTLSIDGGPWRQTSLPSTIRLESVAKHWAAERIDEIRQGAHVPVKPAREGILVSELFDKALAYRTALSKETPPRIRRVTVLNERTYLRRLTRAFGTKHVVHIDLAEVRKYLRGLRQEVEHSTLRGTFQVARMAWDLGKAEKWIKCDNPWRDPMALSEIREVEGKGKAPVAVPLTFAETLASSPLVPIARRIRYVLAFLLGIDDGEIAGLRWKDVELDAPIPFVRITQAVHLRGDKGFATVGRLKTGNRHREIPLHPAAVEALRWWKYHGWPFRTRQHASDNDLVLPKTNRQPWRPKSAPLLRKDLAKCGLPQADANGEPFTFKAMRRAFSTSLRTAGVDVETRGALMGHSGKTVTERNYTLDELRPLFEAVSKLAFTWSAPSLPKPRGAKAKGPSCAHNAEGRHKEIGEGSEMKDESGDRSASLADGNSLVKPCAGDDPGAGSTASGDPKGDDHATGDDHRHHGAAPGRTVRARPRAKGVRKALHDLKDFAQRVVDPEEYERRLRRIARQQGVR